MAQELQQPTPGNPADIAEILTEIKTTLARLDDLWVKLGFTLTFPCL